MKINLKLKNGETVDITDNCNIATRHIFDTIVSLANEQGADICTIEFAPSENDNPPPLETQPFIPSAD